MEKKEGGVVGGGGGGGGEILYIGGEAAAPFDPPLNKALKQEFFLFEGWRGRVVSSIS